MKVTKEFLRENKIKLVFFLLASALYLSACALLLVPEIQTLIIVYAEQSGLSNGKVVPPEIISRFTTIGVAFYIFVLFLFALEYFVINPREKQTFNWELFFILIITALGAAIRLTGFEYKTGDFFTQSDWVTYLRENGRLSAFRYFPGNYNAIYMYILAILSYLPESMELYVMKAASCLFDYICAFAAMKIIGKITYNNKMGLLAYAVVLFSPTVFINSGLWAQSDSMHTAFILLSLYYLLDNRVKPALILFGVGLSFKLQAIFPLPFILYFFVSRKISLKNLLYIFVGFFSVSIPAWLIGWHPLAFVRNYMSGTNTLGNLTDNAPTIFTWGNIPAFMPVVFIIVVLFCVGILIINKKSELSNNTFLLLFLFCSFAVPFFLPRMHERYFYIGEIAVLLYSFASPKRFWISILVIAPALATYAGYLWGTNPVSLVFLSGVMLAGVIVISKWLIESILTDSQML